VSQENELSDLDLEILAHLHLLHLTKKSKSPRVGNPTELLTRLKRSPIKREDDDFPVSSYLRMLRTEHDFGLRDIAAILSVPVEHLEKLESNTDMPWDQSAGLMADVACLCRLHIQAIEALTQNSYDLARLSGALPDKELASAQMSTWLSEVRSELQHRNADDLLT
jgi:transcriptional regulator with XRE-family HTH domain